VDVSCGRMAVSARATHANRLPRGLALAARGHVGELVSRRPAAASVLLAITWLLLGKLCLATWRASAYRWLLRWLDASPSPGLCCFCGQSVLTQPASPYCRLPPRGRRCCHLIPCTVDAIYGQENGKRKAIGAEISKPSTRHLPDSFVTELQRLLKDSPELLKRRDPTLRLCMEDTRLSHPDLICSPSPEPPSAAFAIQGIREIRIVSCALRVLPREIGHMQVLNSLVLMSTELTLLPAEIGNLRGLEQVFLNGNFLRELPASFGDLPVLRDVCLDANQLQVIPPFVSRNLKMLTAPGNLLRRAPKFARPPERLELHGNHLQDFPSCQVDADWKNLQTFKAMCNRLRSLPWSIVQQWRWLEYLNIAGNCIVSLPEDLANCSRLESLFAYNNQLVSLPRNLLRGTRLKRCLLEGNPLSLESLQMLVADVTHSHVQTLALDDDQAFTLLMADSCGTKPPAELHLPPCITVGSLIRVEDSDPCKGMYMKLARSSHLRRSVQVAAAGGPAGTLPFCMKPSRILVVAFAASQGEPEWLGILRNLSGPGNASQALRAYPAPLGSVLSYLGATAKATDDSRFAPLWRIFPGEQICEFATDQAIPDFDVLCVCDSRMRWYAEDAPAVERALRKVCMRYEKKLFVGASMGGFGAMLHGAELADIVLTFGPQSLLGQATLRPPASSREDHLALSARLQAAVRRVRARGGRVEVHCAADTHLEHGLALPLDDLALTVHPIMPRAPFARIMEKAGVLWPVLANALARLVVDAREVVPAEVKALEPGHAPRACIARWGQEEIYRYWVSRTDLLDLFFGSGAPPVPRPEDWFCTQCSERNMKNRFFCLRCGRGCKTEEDWMLVPTVADAGTIRVAEKGYPHPGDWGCGKCGYANQARDHQCYNCGRSSDDHRNVIVQ